MNEAGAHVSYMIVSEAGASVYSASKLAAEEFPQYGWRKNKGYPTREHRLAIREYGLTPHHRLTFNHEIGQLELAF